MDLQAFLTGVSAYIAAFWAAVFLVAHRDRLFGMAPLPWPLSLDEEDAGSSEERPLIFPFWLYVAAMPLVALVCVFLCWPFLAWMLGRWMLGRCMRLRLKADGFARTVQAFDGRSGRASASASAQGT